MTVGFDTALIRQTLVVAAIFIVTYIIGRLFARILRTALQKAGVYQAEAIVVGSAAKYFIYVMGLLVILGYVGIPITSVLVGFVVVALILGFSARNALENLAAWYILKTWNLFNVGDLIMIEGMVGVVREFDPLRTTIETDRQSHYSIPNTMMLQSELCNYSRRGEDFPVEFQLKIPYAENLEELKLRIVDIIIRYPQLSRNKPVQTMVDDISENMALLRVSFFVPEFGLMPGAKDYVLVGVASLQTREFSLEEKAQETRKASDEKGTPTTVRGFEGPKCRMCDSTMWEGGLRCKVCRSYYVNGKCHNCDQIRLEKCPLEGGELEYIPPI